MNKILQEFKDSMKNFHIDEALDIFLFRPFAFLLVKILVRFPVTPNQITFSSIATAVLSAFFFSKGTKGGFLAAGILYGATRVLDCTDGMIARIKKNGTYVGRILDGTVDYVNTIVVYFGFTLGLVNSGIVFPLSPWLLVALTGVCVAVHSLMVDYYKNEFITHALGNKKSALEERNLFSAEFEKLKQVKGKYLDKFLIFLYLRYYLNAQILKNETKVRYNSAEYLRYNKILLRLWNFIGSSTYIFVIMISGLFFKPGIFFYYAFFAANLWMLVLLIIQIRTNKKIVLSN